MTNYRSDDDDVGERHDEHDGVMSKVMTTHDDGDDEGNG